jgi:hypothetical protein
MSKLSDEKGQLRWKDKEALYGQLCYFQNLLMGETEEETENGEEELSEMEEDEEIGMSDGETETGKIT